MHSEGSRPAYRRDQICAKSSDVLSATWSDPTSYARYLYTPLLSLSRSRYCQHQRHNRHTHGSHTSLQCEGKTTRLRSRNTSREIKLSIRFLITLGSGLNSFMSCCETSITSCWWGIVFRAFITRTIEASTACFLSSSTVCFVESFSSCDT